MNFLRDSSNLLFSDKLYRTLCWGPDSEGFCALWKYYLGGCNKSDCIISVLEDVNGVVSHIRLHLVRLANSWYWFGVRENTDCPIVNKPWERLRISISQVHVGLKSSSACVQQVHCLEPGRSAVAVTLEISPIISRLPMSACTLLRHDHKLEPNPTHSASWPWQSTSWHLSSARGSRSSSRCKCGNASFFYANSSSTDWWLRSKSSTARQCW